MACVQSDIGESKPRSFKWEKRRDVDKESVARKGVDRKQRISKQEMASALA